MGASARYLRTGKGSKRRPTEMRVPVSLATAVRSAMAPSAPNVRLVPSSSASVRVERERLAAEEEEEEEKEGSTKGDRDGEYDLGERSSDLSERDAEAKCVRKSWQRIHWQRIHW